MIISHVRPTLWIMSGLNLPGGGSKSEADGEAAAPGADGADRRSTLRAYLREVGPIPTLTPQEEVELAKAIEAPACRV